MGAPALHVVSSTRPDPPYPATTLARGWRFEVDLERVKAAKTWAKTSLEIRPWLFMVWIESWASIPVGTWEPDDEAIAGRIGMPLTLFQMHRDKLLSGWVLHSDGLLYHETITERVRALLHVRNGDAKRAADRRAREHSSQPSHAVVTRDSDVNLTPIPNTDSEVPITTTANAVVVVDDASRRRPMPDCPHEEIVQAWHDALPHFPSIATWTGSRVDTMRARWRDRCAAGKYATRDEGLAYWRRVFEAVGKSDFLAGKTSDKGWQCTLPWLIKAGNFAKFLDGDYRNRA